MSRAGLPFQFRSPCIVAGPCAAEGRAQVMGCAERLVADGRVALMRAGVWKPRTRPGGFEGMGLPALEWLAEAQRRFALPVCVEVATPQHVQAARRAGITAFWVGARTTSDPFAVEGIARSLAPGDGPIFVKNPISPDVDLWVGAIERLRRLGHAPVIAVLRGFYPQFQGVCRNDPRWDVALTLRARMADLPILCDPSHIAGRRDLVAIIAQRAYHYALDGLFVEVHPAPQEALSDAAQQITPEDFSAMLDALTPPAQPGVLCPDEELLALRGRIDAIDDQIFDLLAQRMSIVERVGQWKIARNQLPFQPPRWRALLRHHLRYGIGKGLDLRFVRNLCELVHTESLRLQARQREVLPGERDTPRCAQGD